MRNQLRELPDGRCVRVFPFHISLEGKETRILCREDEDYDVFVKIIAVCAERKGVILVAYGVVSNHGHSVVLADTKRSADAFGEEIKKMYSMFFRKKYGDEKVMKGMDVNAQWLDSDWYLKNAVAYDIRNALDNCALSLEDYPWTSYRAYFRCDRPAGKKVSELKKNEKRRLMHTEDDLSSVPWLLDSSGRLIPSSICDTEYVEKAFEGNPSLFLQKVAGVNMAELSRRLDENPRSFRKDEEVLRNVNDISRRWFQCTVHDLPYEKKARLATYYFRCNRTSVPQMSRVFELSREEMAFMLKK